MKTKPWLLMMLALMLGGWLTHANGLMNQSTNPIVRIGESSVILVTNGNHRFANPADFLHGIWKGKTNGWWVQLCIKTNGFNSNPVVRVELPLTDPMPQRALNTAHVSKVIETRTIE